MMHTEELYDVPEPPKMDDDYYNDLAEQSFEYEGSEYFQDCEDDESEACEARDDLDVDPDEQEAAKHRAEAVEYYDDELQLEMMLEYGGCSESDDDPGADVEKPESAQQQKASKRKVGKDGMDIIENACRSRILSQHDYSRNAPEISAGVRTPQPGDSTELGYYEPRTPEEYEQWCRDFGSMTDKEVKALKVRENKRTLDTAENSILRELEMNTDEVFFYAWMR